MALNAAAFLQAMQPAANDAFEEGRTNASNRQLQQAQGASLKASTGAQEEATLLAEQKREATTASNKMRDDALIGVEPYMRVKQYFTKEFKDNPNDKLNAIDASLREADRAIKNAEIQAKRVDLPPDQAAPEWRQMKSVLEGARSAKGTPEQETAMESVRQYFRAARQGVSLLGDLKIPGFERRTLKEGDTEVSAEGTTVIPKTATPKAPSDPKAVAFGLPGASQATRTVNTNDPNDLSRAQTEGLVPFDAAAPAAPGTGPGARADELAAITAPSETDLVRPGLDPIEQTGLFPAAARVLKHIPGISEAFEAKDQIDGGLIINALGKDFEASRANNPRFAVTELDRLAKSLLDVKTGVFVSEDDLRSQLQVAEREFQFEQNKSEQVFNNSTDKVNRRRAVEKIQLLSGTLQKIREILDANKEGPQKQQQSALERARARLNRSRPQQ